MAPQGFQDKVAFVWKVADKLRGTFKQHEYGSVMLPLLVLRRMDAVLEPTKAKVVEAAEGLVDITPGQERAGISPATLSKLGRGGNVTTDVLARICEALDCDIADICEVVPTDLKGETD